jgi:SpoVK/Ycf46/Vps4 family AAA+-type ATPase
MEEYEGVSILATNLKRNMDDAFLRRLHFHVEFPFPDEKNRFKIWKKIFPDKAPVASDIDFDFLSANFKIAGGCIKNIAVNAAFLAAGNSVAIKMRHIIWATSQEYEKIGRPYAKSDFGGYYDLVVSKER